MTKKQIIAVFAGQGSQFPGMGRDLYENSPAAQRVFHEAVEVLGERITKLCFDTDLETLTQTINAQPAIFTVSYAAWAAFQEVMPEFDLVACAGHSLGEYTALAAAGAGSFRSMLELVQLRAESMQQCGEENEGTMAAVIGLSYEKLDQLCQEVARDLHTVVSVGLFNTPDQLVASGTKAGIEELIRRAPEAGARRAMPLVVGGPFHTTIMSPAAARVEEKLPAAGIVNPAVPVALNAFGEVSAQADRIAEGIVAQVHRPILWVKCVEALRREFPEATVIEFCPKSVLKAMVRKIDRQAPAHAVEDLASRDRVVAELTAVSAEGSQA